MVSFSNWSLFLRIKFRAINLSLKITFETSPSGTFTCSFLVDTARLALELEREPVDPEQDFGPHGRVTRRVRQAEIERQVRRLLLEKEGQTIRQNMQKMKLKAQSAVASGGSSRMNFENYVWLLHAKDSARNEVKSKGIPVEPALTTII